MIVHLAAVVIGFALDLWFGDPHWSWHPVRAIGSLITSLEKKLYRSDADTKAQIRAGAALWLLVILVTGSAVAAILCTAYRIHPLAGLAVESVMSYQLLAAKALKVESMKVYDALKAGDTEQARLAVSMIVGRDTACLSEEGITKAAVETVAENTSDGEVAPLFYMLIGGAAWGFVYKAVNTMDSMIGYKNDRYLYFGRAAAKMDDMFNLIPARLAAWFMVAAAAMLPGFDALQAWKIYRRDRYNHKSPNSAHTEAACAGALHIRLAGGAYYFGEYVEKPFIGDDLRPVETEDIRRANRLLYGVSCISLILGIAVRLAVYKVLNI